VAHLFERSGGAAVAIPMKVPSDRTRPGAAARYLKMPDPVGGATNPA